MPILTDPQTTHAIVLEGDKSKPADHQWKFRCRPFTLREADAFRDRTQEVMTQIEQRKLWYEIATYKLIAVDGAGVPEGPFSDWLPDALTFPEVVELAAARLNGLSHDDRKN